MVAKLHVERLIGLKRDMGEGCARQREQHVQKVWWHELMHFVGKLSTFRDVK